MGRGRAALALLGLALVAGGCASSRSTETVGDTVSVYSILPLHGPRAQDADDIVDGEKLALGDAGGKVGDRTVNFRSVDSSLDGRVTPASAAKAARLAAQDASAIATIATLGGEEARTVLPVVNEAGLGTLSAATTYPGLTQAIPGVTARGEPDRLYPNGHRTFARVIGSDVTQAPAIAAAARRAGCARLDVLAGSSDDDAALAALVGEAIPGRSAFGLADAASTGRGCLLIASGDPVAAARAAGAAPARTLLAPAALDSAAFTSRLTPRAAARTHLISPAPALRDLPPDGTRVAAAFQRTFGRPATPWALLGYDAMRWMLDAIRRAGPKSNDRAVVARALTMPGARRSVLGAAALGPAGDPISDHWTEAQVRAGRPVAARSLG